MTLITVTDENERANGILLLFGFSATPEELPEDLSLVGGADWGIGVGVREKLGGAGRANVSTRRSSCSLP